MVISAFFVFILFYLLVTYQQIIENKFQQTFQDFNPTIEPKKNGIEFKMKHCECQRHLSEVQKNPSSLILNQTTCGSDAFYRGPHQKVISFSFYGDVNSGYSKMKGFFEGIVGNLKLIPKFYPGWIMRLYYDLDENNPLLKDICKLACNDNNLDLCEVKYLPGTPFVDATNVFAMNWRFFPTLDPQVDLYIARDLDSRISDREQAAVEEWLNSSKKFHFMRDHPQHGTAILGGAWGCKLTQEVRSKWITTWKNSFDDSLMWAKRTEKGPDQRFLAKYVWPWAKDISIAHDSYLCKNYPFTKAFPTQRRNEPNNFVGSVVSENANLWQECPKECRPKNHLDWIHC